MSPYVPRSDIVAELRNGLSNAAIAQALGCDRHRVGDIRKELGLPNVVRHVLTARQKWQTLTRPLEGGHLEWTGEHVGASRTPVMRHKEMSYSPAAIAFEIQHGRPAQGYVIADCGRDHCIAPGHVADEAGRQAKRLELRRAKKLGDRPDTCRYGHDQTVNGRLERDGRPYCEACKRAAKAVPQTQREATAAAREAVRRDIEERLRKGIPQVHIASELGVSQAAVRRTREALGLSVPRSGRRERYGSLAEGFRANTEPSDGGHLRWTGRAERYVYFRKQRITAARLSFELHFGRPPVGQATASCGMADCLAGAHLADRPMRQANRRADAAFTAIFGLAS
ncbi:hypothetical protein [Streptomyces sp. STR69]|uniref:hypothetical protein n=1 Tax=Streptomyces sp. STR69 TaxID=1796942 RepID=UPI0021C6D354|nr:hypothetical protein [Streptomyces sp. STR69]